MLVKYRVSVRCVVLRRLTDAGTFEKKFEGGKRLHYPSFEAIYFKMFQRRQCLFLIETNNYSTYSKHGEFCQVCFNIGPRIFFFLAFRLLKRQLLFLDSLIVLLSMNRAANI